MKVYLANDAPSQIAGSRTLWDHLADWLGAEGIWAPYGSLKATVEARLKDEPDVLVIRNATYWPSCDLPNPTIAILQDYLPPDMRADQVAVGQRASMTVTNSAWTAGQYPELAGMMSVIPLPVDFHLFRPRVADRAELQKKWGIRPNSICWVGSMQAIKGYDILHRLIGSCGLNFVTIRKDAPPDWPATSWGGRCRQLGNLSQADLAEVMGACTVGLCTSRYETQHLAGIEMAGCGLPVIATEPVGVYGEPQPWHRVVKLVDLPLMLENAMGQARPDEIASAVRKGPWTEVACKRSWMEIVAKVHEGQHA